MTEKFPGPYRNTVPQDLDNADPMLKRVPVTHTDVGARKSVLKMNIKNDMGIVHAPNMNPK